jgi:hypothetical protein
MSEKSPTEFNPLAALTPQQQKRFAKVRSLLEARNGKPVDDSYWKLLAEHDELFRRQITPVGPESMQKLADDLARFTKELLWMLSLGSDRTDTAGLAGTVQGFYDRAHRLDESHPDRPHGPMALDGAKLASERLLKWTRARLDGENPARGGDGERTKKTDRAEVSQPDPIALAVTMKMQDRKLSVRKAARAVGVHYLALQRNPLWKKAVELAGVDGVGTTPKLGNGLDDPADDRERDPTDIED